MKELITPLQSSVDAAMRWFSRGGVECELVFAVLQCTAAVSKVNG